MQLQISTGSSNESDLTAEHESRKANDEGEGNDEGGGNDGKPEQRWQVEVSYASPADPVTQQPWDAHACSQTTGPYRSMHNMQLANAYARHVNGCQLNMHNALKQHG